MFETRARARNAGEKMHCVASSHRPHDLRVPMEAFATLPGYFSSSTFALSRQYFRHFAAVQKPCKPNAVRTCLYSYRALSFPETRMEFQHLFVRWCVFRDCLAAPRVCSWPYNSLSSLIVFCPSRCPVLQQLLLLPLIPLLYGLPSPLFHPLLPYRAGVS